VKALLLMFAMTLLLAVPQTSSASSATAQINVEDQVIIIPSYPYYYGNYYYPPYYYYRIQPYVSPHGEWRTFAGLTFDLENQVDDLKDIADDVADESEDPIDEKIEDLAKELDKAVDALLNELGTYGIYSPKYIDNLYKNINHHAGELEKGLQHRRGGEVSKSFDNTMNLLGKLKLSYTKINP
jgi:hypothetical protein